MRERDRFQSKAEELSLHFEVHRMSLHRKTVTTNRLKPEFYRYYRQFNQDNLIIITKIYFE